MLNGNIVKTKLIMYFILWHIYFMTYGALLNFEEVFVIIYRETK